MKTSSFGTQPSMNAGSKFSIRHEKKLGLTDTVKFISDKLEVEEDLIALKAFLVAAYYISKQLPFAIFNDESELLFGFNGSALEGNPEFIEAYKEFQAILSGIVDEFSVINVNKFASLQQQRIKEVIDHLKPQEVSESTSLSESLSVETESPATVENESDDTGVSEAVNSTSEVESASLSSEAEPISVEVVSSDEAPYTAEEQPVVEPVPSALLPEELPSEEQVVATSLANPESDVVAPSNSPIVEPPTTGRISVESPRTDEAPKLTKTAGKELTLLEKILLNSAK